MTTRVISLRVPEDLLQELEMAKRIVGAISYSDLLRDALRLYLRELTLLESRAERLKGGEKHG